MVLNFRITIVLFIVLNTAYADFYLNCDDNPCKHGQCTDLYRKTAYQCNCDDGWEGENCDKSIDGANDNNQDKILDKYNYDNNNQDKNENDKVLDKTDDDQDLNKNSNPCGGECKNLGFCNEYSRRCECPERFTGEFCQFSSVHSGNIYDDYAECEKKCTTEDKSRKIDLGSTCDYNYFGSIKTCRCMGFKANSDSGHCLKMLESLEDCQKDCKANTDFAKNETRVCIYHIAKSNNIYTNQKDDSLRICKCHDSEQSCEHVEKNFGAKDRGGSKKNKPNSSMFGILIDLLSNFSWIAIVFIGYCVFRPLKFLFEKLNAARNNNYNAQQLEAVPLEPEAAATVSIQPEVEGASTPDSAISNSIERLK